MWFREPWLALSALPSTQHINERPMSDQPLLHDIGQVPISNGYSGNHLPARPHYLEIPQQAPSDGQGPLPIGQILRRRKGTLFLSAFVGLLGGILITLPQTPVYRARTVIEIQNLNEDFLNMRSVNPTSQDGSSAQPMADLQTQIGILQSESILGQVIADLRLDAHHRLTGRCCPLGQPCHLAVEVCALVVGGHSSVEAEGAFGGRQDCVG